MRLTYWHAEPTEPSTDEFIVIAPTKKQALTDIAEYCGEDPNMEFKAPVKKVVTYNGAYDLFRKAVMNGANAGYV